MLKLSNDEADFVEEATIYIYSQNPEDCALVKQKFECLNTLGEAISQYPSVKETQKLQGIYRSEEQLVEALCSFVSSSHLLHIPASVVASKSYLIAKFQAFSLINILTDKNMEFYKPLRKIIFSIIHTLMAEEVYISCLKDPDFSHHIKLNIANDLVSIWESGTNPQMAQHLSALEALWTARDSSPPSFGTLNGMSELVRITMDLGTDWNNFLIGTMEKEENQWALKEFLFGLSYEEINTVHLRLMELGLNAASHDEIYSYLGKQPDYGIINSSEYRAIYDFYVDRRDAASLRKRISAPGPIKTLEEIYLKYRIAQG